jgi:hypothetical protein
VDLVWRQDQAQTGRGRRAAARRGTFPGVAGFGYELPDLFGSRPPGTRGQTRIYCSPEHRKQAELDARRQRRLETFEAAIGDVPTRDEVLGLLWAAARTGSVLADKTLLEELGRDGEGAPSGVIDELASKRSKPAAIG